MKTALGCMNIPYVIDPGIVRGLDYYTKTVFEIIASVPGGELTVCGGGRYDNLIEEVGGPSMAGVGFGMGMERLLMVMDQVHAEIPKPTLLDIYIANYGDSARMAALELTAKLRSLGVKADLDHVGRSMKAQFKYADKIGAKFILTIGENELETGKAVCRNLATHEEITVLMSAPESIKGIVCGE